jgi:hypothetical protein
MTMTVKGTTELANWIMSMGPWIEVLKPAALRKEIADRHAKAARLYCVNQPVREPSSI